MTNLHVKRSGRGPLLLLLHGIGSSNSAWNQQIDRLEKYFTCLAPDLPGYGDSPDPAGSGLEGFVEEVATVLESRSAHIAGVSFGALVALALARRYPQLVQSLILSDATLGRASLSERERKIWLEGRYRIAIDLPGQSLGRAAQIASPRASAEVIEEIARHMRRARPVGYMAVARAIAATDARSWVGEINAPTLVICGEDDAVTGLDVSMNLAQNMPHARLAAITGAGHAPHIEQPDQFAAAVRGFLHEQNRFLQPNS